VKASSYRLCVALTLILLCATSADPLFGQMLETRASDHGPSNPFAIAIGDFNNDGKIDLAVGVDLGVSVLLGNGDGTFKTAVFYPIGLDQAIESIAIVDLRGDGILDLAVATLGDGVNVLLGNGDGTFGSPISYPVKANPFFIAAGDFTNDGHVDIVALTEGSDQCGCIEVLPGRGDGTLGSPILTSYGADGATVLASGRFNAGANVDVVVTTEGGFNVYLGQGNGTFLPDGSYATDSPPGSIATVSLRSNNVLDLLVGLPFGGGTAVYLGNGNGTFTEGETVPGGFASAVTVGDLNGDGHPDLIALTGYPDQFLTTYLGNGDGTFQAGVNYPLTGTPTFVAVGDFNGDHKQDLALTEYIGNAVSTMLNTGVVSFSPTMPLNFKKQATGTKSAPQTVMLTNTGKAALKISSMKATGQFGMSSTCAASVPAGANCTISVTFAPTSKGAKAGTVTINDSASSKPQVIELSGTGS
jgi:FG-GAP-like repeat/Abnormal spindle-like microcephaly-assoc'd, ASPM-SPD-2-Hydin